MAKIRRKMVESWSYASLRVKCLWIGAGQPTSPVTALARVIWPLVYCYVVMRRRVTAAPILYQRLFISCYLCQDANRLTTSDTLNCLWIRVQVCVYRYPVWLTGEARKIEFALQSEATLPLYWTKVRRDTLLAFETWDMSSAFSLINTRFHYVHSVCMGSTTPTQHV